jgi:hypothetical protein
MEHCQVVDILGSPDAQGGSHERYLIDIWDAYRVIVRFKWDRSSGPIVSRVDWFSPQQKAKFLKLRKKATEEADAIWYTDTTAHLMPDPARPGRR